MHHKRWSEAGRQCIGGRLAAVVCVLLVLAGLAQPAAAEGRHASMAIDANTGKVLHEQAADEPRYPASLTKMMTLYIVFELMEQGRLTPQTRIKISEDAADASPSKLGIPEGGDIALADAIKAIVVKSANDISVAVAEHIAGSEEAFARLMTRKARQIGMSRTTFRNAHGLPDPGQQTTARDMLTLAMRLGDDFPRYYRYFSARSFEWNGASHRNHNTMLATYDGMDGIKTGYIRASGFNLVASVRRDGKHVVAVVFGGSSAAARNVYMRAILDRALRRASPERTREREPRPAVAARSERRQRAAASDEAPPPRLVEPVRPVAARRSAERPGEPERAPVKAVRVRPVDAAAPDAPRERPVEVTRVRPLAVAPRARPAGDSERPRGRSEGAAERAEPAAASVERQPAEAVPPARQYAAAAQAVVRAPSSLQAQAERLERGEEATPATGGRMAAFAVPGLAVRPSRLDGPRPAPGAATGNVAIQIGAFSSEAEAHRRLAAARSKTSLATAPARATQVASGDRTLWRARFTGLDVRAATTACADLRRHQIDCQLVRD